MHSDRTHNVGGESDVYAIELSTVARQIWKAKFSVLVIFLLSVGLGLAYLQTASPQYRATTRLLIRRIALNPGEQPRHEPAFIATQAEILRSRSIVEETLRQYQPASMDGVQDPVEATLSAFQVTPLEGTHILQLSFTSTNREEAVRMLETLVASYTEYLSVSEKDTHLQTLNSLTKTEKELRTELEQKQTQYLDLRRESALIGTGREAGRMRTEYLTDLGKSLLHTRNRRLELENEYESRMKMLAMVEGNPPQEVAQASYIENAAASQLLTSPEGRLPQVAELQALEKELQQLEQWERDLDEVYGDEHPDLVATRARRQEVEAQIQGIRQAIPAVFEEEVASACKYEEELQALFEEEIDRSKQLDMQQLQESQLQAGIERLQTVHDSVLAEIRQRQLANAAAAKEGFVNVKVLARPKGGEAPVWPIPVLVWACSLGVAGCCSLLWVWWKQPSAGEPVALVREARDRSEFST